MNTLIIFLVQTRMLAAIEILSLLLVAAIIGYVTAWLYSKSKYVKRIKALESAKEKEKEHLVQKIESLKALQAEAVQEAKSLAEESKKSEQLHHEKDAALVDIAKNKHLLDYNSFGTATAKEMDDLKMISGIGPFIEERLHVIDIFTFRQISKFTPHDIEAINNAILYFHGRIERDEWVAQAREVVNYIDKREELFRKISERKSNITYDRIGTAKKEEADDLTTISGIGGWISEKLNALDIFTFRQISNFNQEDIEAVTEAIEYFPGRIERDEWILQASQLVKIAANKTELIDRIRDRKGTIYFDKLGVAHKHEANNLTLINGLGLWLEERLNLLGIYTFDQISRLTAADIKNLTEILEIKPGRIKKDDWVGQARKLAKLQTPDVKGKRMENILFSINF